MITINWPPDFDAIKIIHKSLYARVKGTDIWLALDQQHLEWFENTLATDITALILAWIELLN
jgi:hypothetical protein